MNREERLEKVFQKAHNNGWRDIRYGNRVPHIMEGVDYISTIFSHDFAKALWGEKLNGECRTCGHDHHTLLWWQHNPELRRPYIYHLQEMAISDDPYEYIGEYA